MNWFFALPWWVHILVGMALWFSIQNFVLFDDWSVWLAKRENGPMALMPFGVVALIVGIVNLVVWLFKSIDLVWVPMTVAPWLWYAIVFGVIVVIVFFVTRRRNP